MFVEDVGRHNAVDAIAGQMWLDRIDGGDKIFYTTGRLTSEMVIKAAQMGIPFLVSRSGLTQMGYEIAQKVGITMIGRATNKHYLLFTGKQRFRTNTDTPTNHRRRTRRRPGPAHGQRRQRLVRTARQGRWPPGCSSASRRRSTRCSSTRTRISTSMRISAIRVIPDEIGGFAGPLAGLQRGLSEASHPLVATSPCDTPFLPADLVARLHAALEADAAQLAVARTGDQPHPVFCVCRRDVLPHLTAFLQQGGRKIDAWYATLKVVEVAFDDQPDAFSNINTPAELSAFENQR